MNARGLPRMHPMTPGEVRVRSAAARAFVEVAAMALLDQAWRMVERMGEVLRIV